MLSLINVLYQVLFKLRIHRGFFILRQSVCQQIFCSGVDILRLHIQPFVMHRADAQIRNEKFIAAALYIVLLFALRVISLRDLRSLQRLI